MSFSARELSVLAYANGFTLWHYRTADGLAALLRADGYFAAADELLRAGDQILVTLTGGARPAGAALVVTAVAPAVMVAPCAMAGHVLAGPPALKEAAAGGIAAAAEGGWN